MVFFTDLVVVYRGYGKFISPMNMLGSYISFVFVLSKNKIDVQNVAFPIK
jgi:hypothetical protein